MDDDSVMSRRGLILLVALLCSGMAPQPSGQTLQVIPLPKDGEVLVSFKLDETLTDEIRAAINSGLTLKFIYKVDLRRSSAVWVDRTIKSAIVMASLRYDTLTRVIYVMRRREG